ncbi:FtsX-like permease family protein [Rhodobacteraceae bacterium CH30]|nr:FtsX-like permease family protein [Rhodobacteraceae bacterium CH30]
MNLLQRWAFALRLLLREWRSGELGVLLLALVVAVGAMTSVSFFADRIERGLSQQSARLLAADLVVNANAPLPAPWQDEARRLGLSLASSVSFPSMSFAGDEAALSNLKAVSAAYPLRGEVSLRLMNGREQSGRFAPAQGEAWVDARLLSRLKLKLGDRLGVGRLQLTIAGEILREPDGALDLYNFVPRLVFNQADLAASGLIQEGSRARYRLMVAGDSRQVEAFRRWAKSHLTPGMRLENIEEARPEVKTALERARRFLGIATMLTVALAAAAVAMAVRRYLARHWQSVAVMRALGMGSGEVWQVFALLFAMLALACGVIGAGLGYGLQWLLISVASGLGVETLPQPAWWLGLLGPLSSLVLLLGLALPPILALRQVSPLRVMRSETGAPRIGALAPVLALSALLLLAAWQVGDATLGLWLLGALGSFFVAVALVSMALLALVRRLARRSGKLGWRYGVANLARRPWLALIQLVALSVGLMALLLLTVVRGDLINSWQNSIPPDAPNKFAINIQEDQRAALGDSFVQSGRPAPELSPMVRARLLAINGKAVNPAKLADERARRLAEREFNLSWRDSLPAGNQIVAGKWWEGARVTPQFSVEAGLADTLGIRLGDSLSFDIAGTPYQAKVTSLRKVAWDNFRANFFVLAPPNWFAGERASYITSFRLPPESEGFVSQLLARFPNLTVIDIGVIITEVRAVVERLSRAVEVMFLLSLAAGVLVLWATFAATRHERLADMALMRALGASRRQLRVVLLSELAFIGALSGFLAGAGAMLTGAVIAKELLALPFTPNLWLLPGGVLLGMLVVCGAGWPLVGRVANAPPLAVLRAEL